MHVTNLCEFTKMDGPIDKLARLLFMCSSIICCINKSHTNLSLYGNHLITQPTQLILFTFPPPIGSPWNPHGHSPVPRSGGERHRVGEHCPRPANRHPHVPS